MLQPQQIAKHGYPVQTHSVQTEDGYILELHRIPHGKSDSANSTRPAVLIHHALLCSSFDWVGLGPERSLGTSVCLFASSPFLFLSIQVSCDVMLYAGASGLLTGSVRHQRRHCDSFKPRLCVYTSFLSCSFLYFSIYLSLFYFIVSFMSPHPQFHHILIFHICVTQFSSKVNRPTNVCTHLCLSDIRQNLRGTFASITQHNTTRSKVLCAVLGSERLTELKVRVFGCLSGVTALHMLKMFIKFH